MRNFEMEFSLIKQVVVTLPPRGHFLKERQKPGE